MKVADLMSRYVVRVSYDETVFRASELMRRNGIGVLPVMRDRSIVGVVTDRDIITRCVARGKQATQTIVDSVMTQPPVSIEASAPVDEAMALLSKHQIKRLPVTEGGQLCGMLSLSDLSTTQPKQAMAETYTDIFTPSGSDSDSSYFDSMFS